MRFAPIEPYAGVRPIQNFFNPADDTAQSMPQGVVIKAHDPYWGAGEFIYVRANGAIRNLGFVVITPVFDSGTGRWRYNATEVPNTANLGRQLGVAMRAMESGEFGWACVGGIIPANCSANVAADTAFGITAAGQCGAISNGKQVLNARVVAPATTTVVKTGQLFGGSVRVLVPNIDGWFVGGFISGTGVPASTTIASINPSANEITLSAAATVAGSTSLTVTYNNSTIHYNVVHLNRPFAQGQVV
jgi:hypothetical protein